MSEEKRRNGKFMFGFFLGGLLGAIVLFFAGTGEGKKTGKLLQEKGRKFLDELNDHVDEIKDKGKTLAEDTAAAKGEILEVLEEKKDSLADGVADKLNTALSHIEAIQERGRENTATLRKRLFKNIPKKG